MYTSNPVDNRSRARVGLTGTGARSVRLLLAVLLVGLTTASARGAASGRIAEAGDAYVDADEESGLWVIGNADVLYGVHVSPRGELSSDGLRQAASGAVVTQGTEPDGLVTVNDQTAVLGGRGSGFVVTGVEGTGTGSYVMLAVHLRAATRPLVATRYYVVYPGAPALEMWTTFESATGARVTVEDLNAYAVTLPDGPVRWVTGLDVADEDGGQFSVMTRTLAGDERIELDASVISSESSVPYFGIATGSSRIFSGLLWSGAWSLRLQHRADGIRATWGLGEMSAWVEEEHPVEGPHAFVGVSGPSDAEAAAALARTVVAGRAGRPFPSFTTFNTWFVRGIRIDDGGIRRDMEAAAGLGVELFQLDAGWYPGEAAAGIWDFTAGLGSWEVDRARFPDGLAPLGDLARSLGMRFGVWVEPERVALATVGRPGLATPEMLATMDGAYRPGIPNDEAPDAVICLANPAARQWVLDELFRFIDQTHPDYLKWDFNRWLLCTRADHGHPADGGNYAHVQALYEMLAAVRARYPDLVIENCSSGGHRVDFGLARLTDTAWMDDRTAPSRHVRHNLEGLTGLFPAGHLLSYVMPHEDEPMAGASDMAMLVRSRMPGTVGLAVDVGSLGEGDRAELEQQLYLARAVRALRGTDASSVTLTPQAGAGPGWEVIEQVSPVSGTAVIFAFAGGDDGQVHVVLEGLDPDTLYELRSADRGWLGTYPGAWLMGEGLTIVAAKESAAQVLVLAPVGPAWPAGPGS